MEELLSLTHWAGFLPDAKLPPDGHHPTAFIVVCCDTSITENVDSARFDAGIASQTIMLQACEAGMGGCIIGAFKPEEVSQHLLIPKKYKPIVLLALGIPDETVFICNVPANGSTTWNFNVPVAGYYYLKIEYFSCITDESSISSIERKLVIGENSPFKEAS